MKIEITKNNDTHVTVSVSVSPRKYATDPNVHVDSSNIVEFLKENSVEFDNCIKETVVNNYTNRPKLKGEWVFSKKAKPATVNKTVTETTPEAKEGEDDQSTTKRRRRRRASVTKED